MRPNLVQTRRDWHMYYAKAMAETAKYDNVDWDVMRSIKRQLEFMKNIVERGSPSPEDVSRITVGLLAIRNLDDSSPEFASWLVELEGGFRHWSSMPW